ncbi:hypothetical protein [Saccharopolyspora shandongensis]|uniref:hypothetical protein n=1 Tax=Saccharopolyspora shandongensis TaxID=418495 RepID=UPI0033C9F0B6
MTVFVAWLALMVSSANLAWLIISWKKNGPDIHLEATLLLEGVESEWRLVEIVATNNGRQEVVINQAGIMTPSRPRRKFKKIKCGLSLRRNDSPLFPAELTPGAEAVFEIRVPRSVRVQMSCESPGENSLVPYVRVGSKYVLAKGYFCMDETATE